jgi:hypothetical protein
MKVPSVCQLSTRDPSAAAAVVERQRVHLGDVGWPAGQDERLELAELRARNHGAALVSSLIAKEDDRDDEQRLLDRVDFGGRPDSVAQQVDARDLCADDTSGSAKPRQANVFQHLCPTESAQAVRAGAWPRTKISLPGPA